MENKNREVTHDGDDEMEDERKIEMFYSLLRNFRDARDRRRRELHELEKNESKSKKLKTNTEGCFEWQDFTTEIHFIKPSLTFPKPIPCDNNKGKSKEQQQYEDHDLELKL
ncbi:putative NPR1/NH1-interacting protein [Lupinus albus]|uniref:Putative NPR1/NH1-interacting protein n=1 Tax=Lupinus albus TaxID=3870 RepID=A0A6A4QF88_LUPAL|nr:putative NPR1/NH1-interacting protein [Lupinus albus]